jgi:uncharacterized protein (DUF305 family)
MKRTFSMRRAASAGLAAFAVLAFAAACGGNDDDMDGMDHGDESSSEEEAQDFNDADVMFAQMMIPHHEQAVEMAELAETRASDPEVVELAAQIKAAQDPEIETMTGWLEAWGEPTEMEHGMDMPGIMTDEEMAELEAADGAEFDVVFVHHMIAHHQGAIEMAETEIADGQNAEAKELASQIAESQAAEVTQLEGIMARL